MAVATPVHVVQSSDTTAATSITSPPFTPNAGSLYLVYGFMRNAAMGTPSFTTTVPGAVITLADSTQTGTTDVAACMGWFICPLSPGTGRTVTCNFGVSADYHSIFIVEVPSGFDYFNPIAQTRASFIGAGGNATVPLVSTPASTSAVVCGFNDKSTNSGIAVTAPATKLADNYPGTGGNGMGCATAQVAGPNDSIQFTNLNASGVSVYVIAEIKQHDPTPMVAVLNSIPKTESTTANTIQSNMMYARNGDTLLLFVSSHNVQVTSMAAALDSGSTMTIGTPVLYHVAPQGNQLAGDIIAIPVTGSGFASITVTLTTASGTTVRRILQSVSIGGTAATPVRQQRATTLNTGTSPTSYNFSSAPLNSSVVIGLFAQVAGNPTVVDVDTSVNPAAVEFDERNVVTVLIANLQLIPSNGGVGSTLQWINTGGLWSRTVIQLIEIQAGASAKGAMAWF